jgi:hypothetical protein
MLRTRATALVISSFILCGCAVEGDVYDGGGSRPYAEQNVQIPPGHMPPPGECRIWYPDRPTGQQPRPDPATSSEISFLPAQSWCEADSAQTTSQSTHMRGARRVLLSPWSSASAP